MKTKIFILSILISLSFGFGKNEKPYFKIKEGVGILGLVEFGDKLGEVKRKIPEEGESFSMRGCGYSPWRTYFKYEKLGFQLTSIPQNSKKNFFSNKEKNWLERIEIFEKFSGEFENGIKIGKSTREEVYKVFGKRKDDFIISYDSKGVEFGFDKVSKGSYSPNDILFRVSIFKPKKEKIENAYFKIKEGIGVKGIIEIGDKLKTIQKQLGKGKRVNSKIVSLRVRPGYIDFEKYGIRANTNHLDGHSKKGIFNRKEKINFLSFDKTFSGELENGIKIGKSTRQEVYNIYGTPKSYDSYHSIGVSFFFKQKDAKEEKPDDILEFIFIAKPTTQ